MMPGNLTAFSIRLIAALALIIVLTFNASCGNKGSCNKCEAYITLSVRLTANNLLVGEERIHTTKYFLQSFQYSVQRLMESRSGPDRTVSRNDSTFNCEYENNLNSKTVNELQDAGWHCQLPK